MDKPLKIKNYLIYQRETQNNILLKLNFVISDPGQFLRDSVLGQRV